MWFSWSLGLEFCLVWCPLGPDPCQPRWLFVLSLSLVVWFVRRRRFLSFSLSLSLSGAGETQTLFWGLGFPLCSLLPGRALRLQSVLRAFHSHLGQAQLLPFFFSSSSLVGMVAVGCVLVRGLFGLWWWVVVLGLSWLCWASLPCLFFCTQEYNAQFSFLGRG